MSAIGEPRRVELPIDLCEWEGWCLELVNELLGSHPTGHILYVENIPDDFGWKYHAALVLDGVVRDAWFPAACLPPAEYVRSVFGPGATWEVMADNNELEESHRMRQISDVELCERLRNFRQASYDPKDMPRAAERIEVLSSALLRMSLHATGRCACKKADDCHAEIRRIEQETK